MAMDKRAFWLKRVDEWLRSALPASLFAAQHGISVHALRWWKRQLSCSDPCRPTASEKSGISFVELRTESPAVERPGGPGGSFELHLGRYRLSIPADFDPLSLSSLLTVLEGRRGQR